LLGEDVVFFLWVRLLLGAERCLFELRGLSLLYMLHDLLVTDLLLDQGVEKPVEVVQCLTKLLLVDSEHPFAL
jgi:hypothetical protein